MSDARRKSLEQLENDVWGDPTHGSHLVTRCHELRKVPIGRLNVEDLRILIGQQIGLDHLIPLALEVLRNDPLAEGDFYPGDLLKNVLGASEEYWRQHPEERAEVLRLAQPVRDQLPK